METFPGTSLPKFWVKTDGRWTSLPKFWVKTDGRWPDAVWEIKRRDPAGRHSYFLAPKDANLADLLGAPGFVVLREELEDRRGWKPAPPAKPTTIEVGQRWRDARGEYTITADLGGGCRCTLTFQEDEAPLTVHAASRAIVGRREVSENGRIWCAYEMLIDADPFERYPWRRVVWPDGRMDLVAKPVPLHETEAWKRHVADDRLAGDATRLVELGASALDIAALGARRTNR